MCFRLTICKTICSGCHHAVVVKCGMPAVSHKDFFQDEKMYIFLFFLINIISGSRCCITVAVTALWFNTQDIILYLDFILQGSGERCSRLPVEMKLKGKNVAKLQQHSFHGGRYLRAASLYLPFELLFHAVLLLIKANVLRHYLKSCHINSSLWLPQGRTVANAERVCVCVCAHENKKAPRLTVRKKMSLQMFKKFIIVRF